MKRAAGLLGSLVLILCLPARADQAAPKAIKVPIEVLKTKHLAIQVKINGKGPYRMIFDTGAPVTLVSSKVAKDSEMLPKDAKAPPLALFGAMGQFPIQTLEVGGAKADKVPAMVMDHPAVTALSQALGPLEGIVGFPFFARYTMTLDYEKQELTLVPNGYEPADILQTLMATIVGGKNADAPVLAPASVWGVVVQKDEKDEEAGVTISQVRTGSAAAEAGLKTGDRLLTLDGRWTDSVLDCYVATAVVKPGTAVPVVVRRDGKEVKLTVKPRRGF
ncbi:MAG: aspartyl protease family protein [Planctomycetia bacterium]|nr:aspartyl protease family protein [Planctomycetia bacterium]